MVRVANKPILEYYIEFCSIIGISDVRIVMEDAEPSIEKYFQDGAQWNLKITYGSSRENEQLTSIVERNRLLFSGDDLLVINGLVFISYDKNRQEYDFFQEDADLELVDEDRSGLIYLRNKTVHVPAQTVYFQKYTGKMLGFLLINSIGRLFEINMKLVNGESDKYIMSSYNNEEGVFIGQNVEIMKECEISKPVIIGNNIQLKNLSRIGPAAIIGDNTLIDANTAVNNSVVYGDSYIGSSLEISIKIIYKRRVIDPLSGEVLDIVDNFLISEIDSKIFRYYFITAIHCITAFCLMLMQLPVFIILRPFISAPHMENNYWADKTGSNKIDFADYKKCSKGIVNKLFFKFSLDKFHLIYLAFMGRIFLAGNKPILATDENVTLVNELPSYHPAAFYYSETIGHENDEFQSRIDELYYSFHRSLRFDLSIIATTLVQRLFREINE
jgi:NDP-sugar pyrophosphorylase family protein